LSHFSSVKNLVADLYNDPRWALVELDGQGAAFVKKRSTLPAPTGVDFGPNWTSQLPAKAGKRQLARENFNLGQALLILGQTDYAQKEFAEAVRLEPKDPEYNFYLGSALNLLGQAQMALPYLELAARAHTDSPFEQFQLARALAGAGQPERAIGIFKEILSRNSSHVLVCMDLAATYEQVHENAQAKAQWQDCAQIAQRDPGAFAPQLEEISKALTRLAGVPAGGP
jgi:tetratricopeptide (TPR) repeat protein